MSYRRAGVLVGLVEWLAPAVAHAQEREWGWGMHPMWGAWGLTMALMMLVFWGVAIVVIVLGIRWLVAQRKASGPDPALDLLRQRYARGEIDKEEFDSKRRDLGGT